MLGFFIVIGLVLVQIKHHDTGGFSLKIPLEN